MTDLNNSTTEHLFEIMTDLIDRADTYKLAGKYTEAEPIYRQLIAIWDKMNGLENREGALLLHVLAEVLYHLGKYSESLECNYRALSTRENLYGSEHTEIATILNDLGGAHTGLGNYIDAELLYHRSLGIYENHYGSEHPDVAMVLQNIATLHDNLGNFAEAERLLRQSLEIFERFYGSEHQRVAHCLDRLACLLNEIGQLTVAKQLLHRAIAIQAKVSGSEHPEVATKIESLARVFNQSGNYIEAEIHHRQALAIREKYFGKVHPQVAQSLNNLANVLKLLGRLDEAEHLFMQSLSVWKELYGNDNQYVAASLNNLAILYYQRGNFLAAEQTYRNVLSLREKIYSSEHPSVAESLINLAILLRDLSKNEEAVALYRRALEIREKAYGLEHPSVAECLHNFAHLLLNLGRFADAEPLLLRALAILEKNYGPEHPKVALGLDGLSEFHARLGNYAEAELLNCRAMQIRTTTFGPKHPDLANCLNVRASILTETGHHDEAENLYRQALKIWQDIHGPEHPNISLCLNNLARLLRTVGRCVEAERLYRQALALTKKTFGPEHPQVAVCANNLGILLADSGNFSDAEHYILLSISIWKKLNSSDPRYAYYPYSRMFSSVDQISTAIFFAKKAVNECQKLRDDVAQLGKDTLNTFDITIEEYYKHLAALLVEAGRVAEAEYVIYLMKEKEFFLCLGSRSIYDTGINKIAYNALEKKMNDSISTCLQTFDEICKFLSSQGQGSSDQVEFENFNARLTAVIATFHDELDKIERQVSEGSQRQQETLRISDLQRTLDGIDDGTTSLYTFSGKEKFHSILIGARSRSAFTYQITEKDFAAKVFEFRRLLQPDFTGSLFDPLPLAQELYDIIVRPLEDELVDTPTILWNLEGVLRYVPMAALHDGERYLVERFGSVSLTPSSLPLLTDQPSPHWRGCGIGVTKGGDGFVPLPAVKEELTSIIRSNPSEDGILDGIRLLDDEATLERVRSVLTPREFGAIHIASHFKLNPVEMPESSLLLGNNQLVSLHDLSFKNNLFGGAELLTLSACNTASTNPLATGKEVDGFAELAQRQGTKSVLASLWEIADDSTAILMREFYRFRENGITKVESLRRAQLGFITGEIDIDLSISSAYRSDKIKRYRYHYDESKPFSHPYFWAPFVLLGNWK